MVRHVVSFRITLIRSMHVDVSRLVSQVPLLLIRDRLIITRYCYCKLRLQLCT